MHSATTTHELNYRPGQQQVLDCPPSGLDGSRLSSARRSFVGTLLTMLSSLGLSGGLCANALLQKSAEGVNTLAQEYKLVTLGRSTGRIFNS